MDTLGLIWGLAVLPAAPTDWDGAVVVFQRVGKGLPRLARVWADSAYRALSEWAGRNAKWVLDIVTRREGAIGFEVQPWRWVVERTFGWFNRYRRLSKDYEHNPASSEAWIYVTGNGSQVGGVPAKVIDPHLDANILIALHDPSHKFHAVAVKFVTDNKAAGLSVSGQSIREFLATGKGVKPADFLKLQKDYGIQVILTPTANEIKATAARLQQAFSGDPLKRVLRDGDAQVAAAAYLRGEKLGTTDLPFFKRCKDLGIDVEFVGVDPSALSKAANYAPVTVTIPPP